MTTANGAGGSAPLTISPARAADLAAMVAVLSEDALGGHGDRLTPRNEGAYAAALASILADENALLLVARDDAGTACALAHACVFPGLSDEGARLVHLVSLFVGAGGRGRGTGGRLLAAVEDWARGRKARFVTLVSNKKRQDAHRFYGARGYEQRHEGFKKDLGPPG